MKETYYPTGRDALLKTAYRWLGYKRTDDDLGDPKKEKLWRIHDNLYDFTDFSSKHPGGEEWLTMTEGHDITEAFEACHIRGLKVEAIAKKYFVRKTTKPRKSFYTFAEDGFYKTLKRRAEKVLYSKEVGGPHPSTRSYLLQDFLAILAWTLILWAANSNSIIWAVIAGLVLGMNTSAAHNFFHQADSWRQYYWDMSVLSSRDWRISHALSHHLHTNTYNDLEISGIEPYLTFLPVEGKNWLQKYACHVYIQLFYFVAFPSEYIKKAIVVFILREDKLRLENLIPMLELTLMYIVNSEEMAWGRGLLLWFLIHGFCGYWLIFTSLIASHHHPDIYHAGDESRTDTDWGLRQLDSTVDITSKKNYFFFVATTFGNHVLHHLFPTVDHSKLPYLYPVLEETCREFGVKNATKSSPDMLLGMHLQLMRTKPKFNAVGPSK